MVEDYAVKVSIRNGRILRKMREQGIASQTELANTAGVSATVINSIVCLRKAPIKKNGEWMAGVPEIAAALRCDPEDLFSDTQRTLALPKNSHEVYMNEARVAAITSGDMESQVWAKLQVQKLLESIPSERNRQIVEARIAGLTLEEVGEEHSLSKDRVRQIEQREYRRFKVVAARTIRIPSAA